MTEDLTQLDELATELLAEATSSSAHRAARTLIAGKAPLRQTVIALAAGAEMSEHENPGYATVQILTGAARLVAGSGSWELRAGSHLVVPHERHSVHAGADTVLLLSVVLAKEHLPEDARTP
ncbi:MAG TPA: LuxR family transcriptional regulator [Nocardioidaceae bacterium]|jgi:quercetin dioxygenase-like cupin family protein|nr:LuxR family transcriptional regulator [Nocardioidaceae bacterium]